MASRNYQAGEKIIAEGTYGTETYFIESGMVAIRKETGETVSKPLAELGVGEMFGEMVLLDAVGFRSASAVAMTDVTVSVVGRDQLEKDLQVAPFWVSHLLETLKKRLEATSNALSLQQGLCAKLTAERNKWRLFSVVVTSLIVLQWAWPLLARLVWRGLPSN